jgi:hypothetical protein
MANHILYGYFFWYNTYVEKWYAIPTSEATHFFSGYADQNSYMSAAKMDTLLSDVFEFESKADTEKVTEIDSQN